MIENTSSNSQSHRNEVGADEEDHFNSWVFDRMIGRSFEGYCIHGEVAVARVEFLA
jgi:hypothetical protein